MCSDLSHFGVTYLGVEKHIAMSDIGKIAKAVLISIGQFYLPTLILLWLGVYKLMSYLI